MPTFNCNDTALIYNVETNAIICTAKPDGRKLWVKKLHEPAAINNVLYDEQCYYIALSTSDTEGMFLSLSKATGTTKWFIPGRTYLEVLYNGFLYLIFVDNDKRYFLIKVESQEGTKVWFHQIDPDLYFYHFKEDGILLHFASGKKEMIPYDMGIRGNSRV